MITARIKTANTYAIPSESMEPTLQVGERISVDPDAYEDSQPQRGDVIVFDGEDSFTPYTSKSGWENTLNSILSFLGFVPEQNAVVKRVLGTPGDEVSCCTDGHLVINGEVLVEDYLKEPELPASKQSFTVEVPDDRVFVLGDNRNNSYDSRNLLGRPGGGMIQQSRIYGPVQGLEDVE